MSEQQEARNQLVRTIVEAAERGRVGGDCGYVMTSGLTTGRVFVVCG